MRWLLAALAVVVVVLCARPGASAAGTVSPLPSPLAPAHDDCGDCLVSGAEVDTHLIFIAWLEAK